MCIGIVDSDFTLYEDTSETNLDEYIPTELKGRKRQFLLQMETLLINFVNSTYVVYVSLHSTLNLSLHTYKSTHTCSLV